MSFRGSLKSFFRSPPCAKPPPAPLAATHLYRVHGQQNFVPAAEHSVNDPASAAVMVLTFALLAGHLRESSPKSRLKYPSAPRRLQFTPPSTVVVLSVICFFYDVLMFIRGGYTDHLGDCGLREIERESDKRVGGPRGPKQYQIGRSEDQRGLAGET